MSDDAPAGVRQADRRQRLQAIIQRESVLTGGDFQLSAGGASTLFFDMKKTMLHPEGSNLVAELMLDALDDGGEEYVGGLEMGAVPLVAAVCVKSFQRRPVKAFFVRKAVKDHGTAKLIDGQIEDGAAVVLVEDVTTTGASVLKACRVVRARGSTLARVITSVDRREGARENHYKEGLD
ncbi:MAG: orotate phosphoribosyltransferase, partial [Rhodospirillales bacterium]|nr:orotate phosphoribosyltransferase [Rhodospirillales bacterium]